MGAARRCAQVHQEGISARPGEVGVGSGRVIPPHPESPLFAGVSRNEPPYGIEDPLAHGCGDGAKAPSLTMSI